MSRSKSGSDLQIWSNSLVRVGAEYRATEEIFYCDLDGPIVRITTPHIPLPAADALEGMATPSVERIVATVGASINA